MRAKAVDCALIGTSDVPTFAAVSDQRLAESGQQVVAFSQLQLRSIPRLYDMQNSLAVRILRGSLFLIIALISSFLPRLLGLPEYTQQWADVATTLALFMQGVIWANIIIGYYIQRYVRVYATDGSSITTFKALGAVARLTIWIILGLVALSVHGVQVRTLLTGLGIGGLAVALAVQNILGDLFAAIAIVMDKPFVVGDSISVENYRGKVENIGLKTTRVRSESGEQIIFANGELLKSKIRNYSR